MSASKLDLDNESVVVGKQRQQTQHDQQSENKGDCAIAADSASCETNTDSWIAVKPILVNTNIKQEIVNIVSLSVEFDKVHIKILN